MKFVFFSGLIALALSGCGGGATTAPRDLQCYVRFDAIQRQVQADATLHQSTSLQTAIEMPGGILYQGSEMHIVPLQGLTYRRIYAAEFVPEHTFSWVDEKGQRQNVTYPMAAISKFTFGDQPLSHTQPATLRWEGGPLEKGEALTLIWENKQLNQTVPMEIISSGGDPSIVFPGKKIAELAPGEWTLYIVRKRLVKTNVEGFTTQAVLEYYSKSDTIEVR